MSLSRRKLLTRGAAGALGVVGASTGVAAVAPQDAHAEPWPGQEPGRPARLFPPLESTAGDLLALPPGFSYEVIAEANQTDIEDGRGHVVGKTPERIDGMGVVQYGRRLRLLQNHEISLTGTITSRVPLIPGTTYDSGALAGGVSVVETTRNGRRRSQWVGLSGTLTNCAGGITPWGSWLTCEETEVKAGAVLQHDHGYIFEVFPEGPDRQSPKPIKAWGRAPHEAVVVHPNREMVYITEDASNPNGLLYRWTAPAGFRLGPYIANSLAADAGRLEALIVLAPDGSILPDLAYVTAAQIGRPFRTRWKQVPDRDARDTSMRKQFADGEITRSKKLEGAWGDKHGMYFDASFAISRLATSRDLPDDATQHDGQIWYYNYRHETVTLVAYFPYNPTLHDDTIDSETGLGLSRDLAFDGPDNVHVSPYGSLILAEDGDTAQHLLSWSRQTGAQAVARNLMVVNPAAPVKVYSEMAGPTFSPDGRILFANVQAPGHTFAIRGPWRRYLGSQRS